MIKNPLLLVSLLLAPVFASQNIVDRYNKRVEEEGIAGRFTINSQGYMIFDGESSPSWAIDQQLDSIGLTKGYGTGGIDPFKIYTYDDYVQTGLHNYLINTLGLTDRWLRVKRGQGEREGSNLLAQAKQWGGDDILKEIHEHEKKVSKRNEEWNFFFDNLVPKTFQALTNPKFALVVLLGTLILIGCPIVIWNFSKSLFRWLFVRRPTILGEKDSDIYGSFLKRLLWKYPSEPKVIANPELQKKLDSLVTTNQLITKKNKQLKWYEKSRKTPYPHIMAYGKAGIGKTLFAKNLAKNSGMHFMYMTVADLSQMPEEEALRTLKDFFAYAKRFAPCVLIVDEADRLFDFKDIKAQKLALLFQKEFAKAVHEDIQLFFITNYPQKFPRPILSRIPKKIYFDKPNFETQKNLFRLHLNRAFKKQKKEIEVEKFLTYFSQKDIKGLVGRDIEFIAIALSLREECSSWHILEEIKNFQETSKDMENFIASSEEQPRKKQEKQVKKWFEQ